MTEIISNISAPGIITACLFMLLLWIYQAATKNAGVVDIGWAMSIVIMAGFYLFSGPGYFPRKAVIFTMALLWGVRLTGLLLMRMIKDKDEDRRYQRIRKDWGQHINLKFLFLFEFQALLAVVLSLPFLIVSLNNQAYFSFIELIGIALWVVGFAGEIISDEQMRAFKNDPENKGKVCEVGFWNYSRHPNYFFEWVMWLSYFIFALGSPYGWIAVISPAIMFYFLIYVTGVPFAEAQALLSKGEAYKEYQRTTSFFVPMPKEGF